MRAADLGRPDAVHEPAELQRGRRAEPGGGPVPHPRLRPLLAVHAGSPQRLPRLQGHLGRAVRDDEEPGPLPRAGPGHRCPGPDHVDAAELERGEAAGAQRAHSDHGRDQGPNLQPVIGRFGREREPKTGAIRLARGDQEKDAGA